jgi:hypothetical protein
MKSKCQYSLSELIEVIAATPGIEWDDVKDAPLLQMLIANHDCKLRKAAPQTFPPRISVPPRKRKRTTPVKAIRSTVTAAVQAVLSSYFDQGLTIVGKRPSYLDDEKLARGQPQILPSTDQIKYKVCLFYHDD